MSGARRMQELKYFRDGATLVISLDGLNWLFKRRCRDKGLKKRNEELQLLMSPGQMIQADVELQAITCILDHRGTAAPQLWKNTDCRSGSLTHPPSPLPPPFSTSTRYHCLLEEPAHHSTIISLGSFGSEHTKEALWTRLILNMQDIFSLLKKDLNIVSQQDTVTMHQHNNFIIFCNEDIPLQRFGNVCCSEDCRTSIGDTSWHVSENNMISGLKNVSAHGPSIDNFKRDQQEVAIRDNFNNLKSLLKSCQIYNAPGVLSRKDSNVKKRKRVSFDDDVMVYLFDQESPTMELHTEARTPLPDVTLEDSGTIMKDDSSLEWDDDFSALEKNCHFQQYALSLPTQSPSALSRRFFLPQTCLFLTHVTESDLEP